MAILKEIKFWQAGGLNTDDAIEFVPKNDYIYAENIRMTGTDSQEAGNVTNIESNELLSGSLLAGINDVIGGNKFDNTGQIVAFRYNSAGENQILLYENSTGAYTVIFTDDPANPILPLDPQNIVKCILINSTYLVWWAKDLEVGYTNLTTLASGGYGATPLWEDLSLLKPQCMVPPTGTYGSDQGQPANYLFGLLPQFIVQYVNADFNYSAWSTRSKRLTPIQQNTPTSGSDVSQNNYIIVTVNIGSIRASVINIGVRFDDGIFSVMKSVDRTYVTALTNTAVDVDNEIYEAYDSATNTYSFAYYNNNITIPIAAGETDHFYDYIWPANAGEEVNGNIIALGDWKTLYSRPATAVTIGAVGYDPNIDIPVDENPNPFVILSTFPGESGSGEGDHKRRMKVAFAGNPMEGDTVIITLVDIRSSTNTVTYTYTVPASQEGDQPAVVQSVAENIPNSNYYFIAGGMEISFVGDPYFGLQQAVIRLAFDGATVANSIPSVLDNTVYQLALSHFDYKGRPFPLCTDNTYITKTASYAQVNGNATQITWAINSLEAPVGAVSYQWMLTKPPISAMLDTLATPLNYKGAWDAKNNTPTLAPNVGTVGDLYQITTPYGPAGDTYTDLGTTENYNTGDYVVYNGEQWNVIPRSFGDLTTTGNVFGISLNPLRIFNDAYSNDGVNTILGYDFAAGDRCTIHYYIDGGGNNVYLNNPCVDLAVFGYDVGSGVLKVEKSAGFDLTDLEGKNIFIRLYSPAATTQTASTVQNSTVWYEIGERFTITAGMYDTLSGVINDGGVYYKTRQFADGLLPYSNPPVQTLATDFNYSDFYASAFSSFGRVRTYYDLLEQTEQKASIITSDSYVLGSKNNGLNRFYPERIYGDGDGQTSSSYGGVQIMWQRGNTLVVIQELGTFYVPVNISYTQVNSSSLLESNSDILLNKGRYDTAGIGIGFAKESFCTRYNVGYFVDPNKSIPMVIQINGIEPFDGKMSQYFKSVLQVAYGLGKKLFMFYDDFYEEVILCIQASGGILTLFPFSDVNWRVGSGYTITGSDITATPNGAHCSASYNPTTGFVTYTPSPSYVGTDSATFTFTTPNGPVTVNNCLEWTAGSSDINPFSFADLTMQAISTLLTSNSVLISGNTIPVAISVVGGEYSINGGAWTSVAGTISSGSTVRVRQTSSGSYGTTTDTTLTVSGFSDTFSVTTKRQVQIDYELDEQLSPFVDSNILITANGVTVSPFPVLSPATGTVYVLEGDVIEVTGYADTGNAAVNPKIHMEVHKDAVELYNDTEDNDPPPTVELAYGFTAEYGFVYDVLVSSYSDSIYDSAEIDASYRKNDCAGGETGTFVHVFIAAGTYTSAISQMDADDQAEAAAQTQANSEGTCLSDTFYSTLLIDYQTDTDADLCCFVETAALDETGIIVTGTAETPSGPLLLPDDGTDPANCYLLSSDKLATGSPAWRFGINLAYFAQKYSGSIASIKFRIQGRAISAGARTLSYAPRAVTEGYLQLGGSTGSRIPSVSSGSSSPTGVGSNVVSGADGTVGTGVGSPILDLEYTFATNAIVHTTY